MEDENMKTKSFLQYQCGIQPRILIVSPPYLGENLATSPFAPFFDVDTVVENSKHLALWYELVAKQFDCDFLDAATICKAGDVDSLHLMEEGHKALAEGIYRKILEMKLA